MLKTPLDTINPSFKPSCPVENIPKNVLIERNKILSNLPRDIIMVASISIATNNILIIRVGSPGCLKPKRSFTSQSRWYPTAKNNRVVIRRRFAKSFNISFEKTSLPIQRSQHYVKSLGYVTNPMNMYVPSKIRALVAQI